MNGTELLERHPANPVLLPDPASGWECPNVFDSVPAWCWLAGSMSPMVAQTTCSLEDLPDYVLSD